MDINNIYFYLLLGVFFYFLFTYILENYLVEQENFDPSLVPVSSIVTLAKVAQKLVNGNGTLTNPGNLQIGKDVGATSGNLTVTGKTAIGSTTMGDKTLNVTGTLGVSGDTTVGGKLDVNGATTMNGISSLKTNVWHTSTDGANRLHYTDKAGTYFGSGDGTYYWRSNNTGKMDASGQNGGIMELDSGGNLKVSGNATINGNTALSGLATTLLIKKGAVSPDNTKIEFGDGSGLRLRFQKDDVNPIMDIVDNKNVNVHGNTTVSGNLSTAGNLTVGGRNILAELDRLNKYLNGTNPIRLRRVGDDGKNDHYFKGDGWVGTGDGWSPWRIYGTV